MCPRWNCSYQKEGLSLKLAITHLGQPKGQGMDYASTVKTAEYQRKHNNTNSTQENGLTPRAT